MTAKRACVLAAALWVACVLGVAARQNDWPTHDHDPGGQRFSPLTQITPANVASLQVAWTFDARTSNLEVTPLVVGGRMFVTAGTRIFALEPETGHILWTYEANADVSRRGVAYWPGDGHAAARVFSGAGERMVALDAATGLPVPDFGMDGFVDLKTGIRGDVDGRIGLQSPPAIYQDIVITGGNNGEQAPSDGLYGDIRGWDARTGKLLWSFHTVPRPGEPGNDTWADDSWKNRSGTNMWAFFTVDTERGLVFAPLGAPTSDYYGADRHGANLYGNCIVALDARTGKLKWFHQLVHHDLWDYDLPAAPTLIDVHRHGQTIPAVAVLTKMSTLFIFNRVTGEPLYGLEERPVPQSTVPGEASWPTQPFPQTPPPLGRITFDPATDFYTLTPDHAAYCQALWKDNAMYTKGPFTPAGTEGTMVTFPSTIGGGNWNGLSYDPGLGLVFTNVMNLGQVARMVHEPDRRTGGVTWHRTTPWGGIVGRFWDPSNKIPCQAPPFGELVAVDVNRGTIAWRTPLGFIPSLKEKGFGQTGALSLGGGIATASGLIFIGATTDGHFRAFASKTGQLLWDAELPASAHSVPMTFLGKDGRQYVVVAAGGGGFLGSPPGTEILAFTLPGAEPKPALHTSAPPTAEDLLPDGPGKRAVLMLCRGCHGPDRVLGLKKTHTEWAQSLQTMVVLGMRARPDQLAQAQMYLDRVFSVINVNLAPADELAAVLGVPASVAAAIVEYRQAHGRFASAEDLLKVPGLEAAAVERMKARLIY